MMPGLMLLMRARRAPQRTASDRLEGGPTCRPADGGVVEAPCCRVGRRRTLHLLCGPVERVLRGGAPEGQDRRSNGGRAHPRPPEAVPVLASSTRRRWSYYFPPPCGASWCRQLGVEEPRIDHPPFIADVPATQKAPARDRILSFQELAAILDECLGKPEREHLIRFIVVELGAAGRPEALWSLLTRTLISSGT